MAVLREENRFSRIKMRSLIKKCLSENNLIVGWQSRAVHCRWQFHFPVSVMVFVIHNGRCDGPHLSDQSSYKIFFPTSFISSWEVRKRDLYILAHVFFFFPLSVFLSRRIDRRPIQEITLFKWWECPSFRRRNYDGEEPPNNPLYQLFFVLKLLNISKLHTLRWKKLPTRYIIFFGI